MSQPEEMVGRRHSLTEIPTVEPPLNMFEEFRKIIGDTPVLGIYSREGGGETINLSEYTIGRRNIVEPSVRTSWVLSDSG